RRVLDQGAEYLQCLATCLVGVVLKRIEFDGQPAIISSLADGRNNCGKVDCTGTGDEMVMDPRRRDILNVVMADLWRELQNGSRQVFADAKGMADVEVQPD